MPCIFHNLGNPTLQGFIKVLAEYRVQPHSAPANKWNAARAVWDIPGTQGLSLPARSRNFIRSALRGIARRI